MSKARTDAQGRKFDAEGNRVYDVAGANTYVEAVHPGTYPANHLRAAGEKFKLKEGDGIVDWMREVEGDEAPSVNRKAAKVPNKPRNIPEPNKPNGDQQPGDETGNATEPSTAQDPDQIDPELA